MILSYRFVSVNPFLIYFCDISCFLRFISIFLSYSLLLFHFLIFSKTSFRFIMKKNGSAFPEPKPLL